MHRSKTKKKTLTVGDVVRGLELLAPSGTAEKWDNVGLLAGDPGWNTRGAVVSIDLTAQSIAEAKRRGYRLIVNHHPCIFPKSKGLSKIVGASGGMQGLVFDALQKGISVVSSHTNFDQCALEVVKGVSEGLGVKPRGRLLEAPESSLLKLVVFVPRTHLEKVREALSLAGAGHVGQYDQCTFGVAGEGTFRGGKDTKPFLGKPGQLEKAQEIRLETLIPRGLKKSVLKALSKSHPYEEVAYDLYSVEQGPAPLGLVRGLGYGFWGEFDEPRPFSVVAEHVKRVFQIQGFWLTEPPPRRIKRLAFAAGKGSSFVEVASQAGCDLFITGETGYHGALDGYRRGMAVMELGHRESEIFYLKTMETWLSQMGLETIILNQPTQRIVHLGGKS